MKFTLSLFLFLLLTKNLLLAQNIVYTDSYQLTPVTMVKQATPINGRDWFQGTGTDRTNTTYTYKLSWCSPSAHAGQPGWTLVIVGENDNCGVNDPYWYNGSNTMAPPGAGTGTWVDVLTIFQGPPSFTGPGIYGYATISTTTASSITAASASSGGVINAEGGLTTTERGVVYGPLANPTVAANSKAVNASGLTTFTQALTNLNPGTNYHYRAYATNSFGTAYGEDKEFTTLTPTITASNTSVVASTTFGTASANGSFTVSGANMVAGILVSPPTGFEVSTSSGSGFASSITVGGSGSIGNTTVYVRLTATTAAGNYSGNINLTSTSATAKTSAIASTTVNKYNITLTANNVGKTYGDVLTSGSGSTAYSVTTGSMQNSNTLSSLTITYGTGAAANADAGSYNTVVPSAVVGANGFTTNNYNINYVNGNINVGTRALTLTAQNATRVYGSVLSGATGSTAFSTTSGIQNSETVGSVTVSYTAGPGNGNAQGDAVATYTGKVIISDATGGTFKPTNYNINYVPGNISVTPAVLTYAADAGNKIYGASNPVFTGTVTGFVNAETQLTATTGTLTFLSPATESTNTGSYLINGSGLTANNGNYTFAQASGNAIALTITPATLTYTANAVSRDVGQPNPAFSGTVTGFVLSQSQASATTGTLAFDSPATQASSPGSYAINGSGLTANNGNYTFVQDLANATALTIANPAPVLAGASNVSYIEDNAPISVNPVITVTDGNNTTLVSATVTISNHLSGDLLEFSNVGMGNITGSYDTPTGTLTLTSAGGTATIAQFQAALRSVTYSNTSNVTDASVRNVDFQVNDGLANSNSLQSTVKLVAVDCAVTLRYVKEGGSGDGLSWLTASGDLQDMINHACEGTEVWVAAGTYKPATLPNGMQTTSTDKSNAFLLKKDVKVFGGFAGSETSPTERDLTANTSTLSGDIDNTAGISGNAYHVVVIASDAGTATLDGFTIAGGNALGDGTSVTVNGWQVTSNGGGGIYCTGASPTLSNLLIRENAGRYGAGVYTGGNAAPLMSNSIVSGNTGFYGGGFLNSVSEVKLVNVLISGNTAVEQGGGMYNEFGTVAPTLINTTISGNNAPTNAGGAMYNVLAAPLQIHNSIIYGNSSGIFNAAGTPHWQNSLVQGESNTAEGNIDGNTDPLFAAALPPGLNTGGDYRLTNCSPVIDGGNNSLFAGATTDLNGNDRFYHNGIVDMGAFEFQSTLADARVGADEDIANINITTGQTLTLFSDGSDCKAIATITSVSSGDQPVEGGVSAKLWIESTQPSQYVKRHYQITPLVNPGTATGKVTLYATDDDFNTFNTQSPTPANLLPLSTDNSVDQAARIANIRIEKRDGVSSDGSGLPATYSGSGTTIDPEDTDIVWNDALNRWEISFDVTGFSGFFIKSQSAPLPVHWVSIQAAFNVERHAVISWKVVEKAVASYSVQKSADGHNFVTVADLSGEGDGLHQYRVTDPSPVVGTAYYRVLQTDLDGTFTFSRIVSLSDKNNAEAPNVYPIPAGSEVTVEVKGEAEPGYRVTLTNQSGTVLMTRGLYQGINHLDIKKLAPGIYLLRTSRGEVYKIIRE